MSDSEKSDHQPDLRFRAIAESSIDAIYTTDDQSCITFWNPAAAAMFGYSAEEIIGKTNAQLMPPDLKAREETQRLESLAAGVMTYPEGPFESVARRKDGTLFPVEVSISSWEQNGSACFSAIVRDISERKKLAALLEATVAERTAELRSTNRQLQHDIDRREQAEAALRESEQRFRTIFENMNDGVLIADEAMRFHDCNRRICAMLGYRREELIDRGVTDIHPAESLELVAEQFQKLLRGELITAVDIPVKRKDGSIFFADISAGKVSLAGRVYSIGIFHDSTERKQNAEELERRVRKRTEELQQEIEERRRAEAALLVREQELHRRTVNLQEVNTAMKVLLARRDKDKEDLEEKILLNLKEFVAPYLERLKGTRLEAHQADMVRIIEKNLQDIISPFAQQLTANYMSLTPTEVKVANLIKAGWPSKDIARSLGLSKRTIDFYRENIRKKLGLNNQKVNLRTHLLSYR